LQKNILEHIRLGKTMICNGQDVLVKAVVRDRPSNSDIRIDALLTTEFHPKPGWMILMCTLLFIQQEKPDIKKFF